MNNKRFVRIVAIVLAIIMLFGIVMIALTAIAGGTASARVTQTQIDNLRGERRELERQRNEIESEINAVEFERMAEIQRKEILDRRIMVTGLEIENINSSIEYFETLIREKEYEVFLAQTREDEQLDRFRSRVRSMEENGIITYLEIIFDATSFADMLARIDIVGDIMRADQEAYDDLTLAREDTEEARDALEEAMDELNAENDRLEEKETELYEQVGEASALIIQMEYDIETDRQLHAMLVEEEENLQRDINALVAEFERQQEAERQRLLAEQRNRQQGSAGGSENAPVSGTGEFTWPVPGHHSVSSPFGVRRHPIHGDLRQHNGIDIPAPHGTPVVASDSGQVITSSFNSVFGNFIVIAHGNNTTTLYAHLSSRGVSVGDTVSRGQQIGRIGSTGWSTGPHLHFEISVNGQRINPQSRL